MNLRNLKHVVTASVIISLLPGMALAANFGGPNAVHNIIAKNPEGSQGCKQEEQNHEPGGNSFGHLHFVFSFGEKKVSWPNCQSDSVNPDPKIGLRNPFLALTIF